MLKQVTESISKAVKEVKVSVLVHRWGKELEFSAIEYFVDYSADFASGLPGGGGGPIASARTGSRSGRDTTGDGALIYAQGKSRLYFN